MAKSEHPRVSIDSDIFPVIFLDLFEIFQKNQKIRGGGVPPPLAEALQKAERLEALEAPQVGQGLEGFEGFEEIEAFCGDTFRGSQNTISAPRGEPRARNVTFPNAFLRMNKRQ